jgi:hypothetical protein
VDVDSAIGDLVDLDELKRAVGAGGSGGDSRPRDMQVGGEPPADRVIRFLDTLRELMIAALERPAFFTNHNRLLRNAWRDVRPRFEVLQSEVRAAGDNALALVGLTGAELDLKLAVFEDAATIFLAELDRMDRGWVQRRLGLASRVGVTDELLSPPPGQAEQGHSSLVGRLLKGTKVSLGTLLEVADKTVKSAAAAVGYANPAAGAVAGAAAEGIDEFKGMMEGILKLRKKKQNGR